MKEYKIISCQTIGSIDSLHPAKSDVWLYGIEDKTFSANISVNNTIVCYVCYHWADSHPLCLNATLGVTQRAVQRAIQVKIKPCSVVYV